MPTTAKPDIRDWANSVQRTAAPEKIAPERAMHYGVRENRAPLPVKQLPADFAERVYEEKVKGTPGIADAMERVDQVFEDWKRSL